MNEREIKLSELSDEINSELVNLLTVRAESMSKDGYTMPEIFATLVSNLTRALAAIIKVTPEKENDTSEKMKELVFQAININLQGMQKGYENLNIIFPNFKSNAEN